MHCKKSVSQSLRPIDMQYVSEYVTKIFTHCQSRVFLSERKCYCRFLVRKYRTVQVKMVTVNSA